MSKRPAHRINESLSSAPQGGLAATVNEYGELQITDANGDILVLTDQDTGQPILFDDLMASAGASAGAAPTAEAVQQAARAALEDGRTFARAGMTAARRAKLEARDQRTAAPTPSTHPDPSTRDGQNLARSRMTPEQRTRLERRDRLRRG